MAEQATFEAKIGSPFMDDILAVEEKAQEIREGIGRQLRKWETHKKQATDAGMPAEVTRAEAEIRGLYQLLGRLQMAVS